MSRTILKRLVVSVLATACLSVLPSCTSVQSTEQTKASVPPAPRLDTLILNGQCIDGSNTPAFACDVGMKGDRIAEIGDLDNRVASKTIDAKGQLITPGFINVLSWANESLILDGRGLSDLHQGITLEIFGEGHSPGPLNEAMKTEWRKSMSAERKIDIRWNTLGEYLDYLQAKGVSPNIASFVGAATVREYVLGFTDVKATPAQLQQMQNLVDQAMQEGALGVGSSLIYAPGTYASTEELIALASVAGKYQGAYISHLRSEGARFLEALEELLEITAAAKVHGEVYHLKAAGMTNWPKMAQAIARIEKARADGLDVSANMYTYIAGATGLDAAMPTWVQAGGYDEWRKRLQDPNVRKRVLAEMKATDAGFENLRLAAGKPENVVLLGFKNPELRKYTGKHIGEVANYRGQSIEDAIIDLVIEDGSRVEVAYFLMSEDNVRLGLSKPWVTLGSDAEALAPEGVFMQDMPHPRTYGNVARFLEKYVRDEKLVTLEEAIHRLTELPAKNFKLTDRGCLKVGCYADINVFDLQAINEHTTFEKPHQLATGMSYVLVNGAVVIDQGKHTGAMPGQVVRGPGFDKKTN
jgi:N-acyl-D-amino-acid deacylase